MGKGILYCAQCGNTVREDDFARGKAQMLDDMPYCGGCKPAEPASPPPLPAQKGSSQRIPMPAKQGSSQRLLKPSSTTRMEAAQTKPPPFKNPVVIGGAVAAVALVVLLLLLLGGGRKEMEAPVETIQRTADRPSAPPPPEPPRAILPRDPLDDRVKDLEAMAATAPPETTLARVDALRAKARGTPHEATLARIETQALQVKAELERAKSVRIEPLLAEIRQIIAKDPQFARKQEVLTKFAHALTVADGRRPQVQKMKDDYARDAELAAKRATVVGHWKLDDAGGGQVAKDASGRNQSALVEGPVWTEGKIGSALSFDGKDDFIALPPTPALLEVQNSSYTLSAWFKPGGTPPGKDAAYGILVKPGFHEGLSYNSEGKFVMDHWLTGDVHASAFTNQAYPAGAWHHVVGIVNRTGGITELFLNAKRAGRSNWEPQAATRRYGEHPWRVGIANPGAKEYAWPAKGVIDDVRIYNRVLSIAEIAALFEAGTAGRDD